MYSYNMSDSSSSLLKFHSKWGHPEIEMKPISRSTTDFKAMNQGNVTQWFLDLFPHGRSASAWAAINIP